MSMYLTKAPAFIQHLYNRRVWMMDSSEKAIYLTFDDGPDPDITPQILDLCSKSGAKVTFFHLGSKAESYPSLVDQCRADGHTVGNHGYDHLDGLKISNEEYFKNLEKGKRINQSALFRPPYGRMKWSQKKRTFESNTVIMGDIMPGDFDENKSIDDCIQTIKTHAAAGSIIVLHENEKSKSKIIPILKWVIPYYCERGFEFKGIDME